MIGCPLCNGNAIGKVGSNQFYCWNCCVEFLVQKNKITVYEVGDDGNLTPYSFQENQMTTGG